MVTLPKIKVGDRLVLHWARDSQHREDFEVEVVRVGRKFAVATRPGRTSPLKFRLDTGDEDAGGYAPRWRMVTPEILAEEKRRAELLSDIRDYGFEQRMGPYTLDISTEALAAIAKVLIEDKRNALNGGK